MGLIVSMFISSNEAKWHTLYRIVCVQLFVLSCCIALRKTVSRKKKPSLKYLHAIVATFEVSFISYVETIIYKISGLNPFMMSFFLTAIFYHIVDSFDDWSNCGPPVLLNNTLIDPFIKVFAPEAPPINAIRTNYEAPTTGPINANQEAKHNVKDLTKESNGGQKILEDKITLKNKLWDVFNRCLLVVIFQYVLSSIMHAILELEFEEDDVKCLTCCNHDHSITVFLILLTAALEFSASFAVEALLTQSERLRCVSKVTLDSIFKLIITSILFLFGLPFVRIELSPYIGLLYISQQSSKPTYLMMHCVSSFLGVMAAFLWFQKPDYPQDYTNLDGPDHQQYSKMDQSLNNFEGKGMFIEEMIQMNNNNTNNNNDYNIPTTSTNKKNHQQQKLKHRRVNQKVIDKYLRDMKCDWLYSEPYEHRSANNNTALSCNNNNDDPSETNNSSDSSARVNNINNNNISKNIRNLSNNNNIINNNNINNNFINKIKNKHNTNNNSNGRTNNTNNINYINNTCNTNIFSHTSNKISNRTFHSISRQTFVEQKTCEGIKIANNHHVPNWSKLHGASESSNNDDDDDDDDNASKSNLLLLDSIHWKQPGTRHNYSSRRRCSSVSSDELHRRVAAKKNILSPKPNLHFRRFSDTSLATPRVLPVKKHCREAHKLKSSPVFSDDDGHSPAVCYPHQNKNKNGRMNICFVDELKDSDEDSGCFDNTDQKNCLKDFSKPLNLSRQHDILAASDINYVKVLRDNEQLQNVLPKIKEQYRKLHKKQKSRTNVSPGLKSLSPKIFYSNLETSVDVFKSSDKNSSLNGFHPPSLEREENVLSKRFSRKKFSPKTFLSKNCSPKKYKPKQQFSSSRYSPEKCMTNDYFPHTMSTKKFSSKRYSPVSCYSDKFSNVLEYNNGLKFNSGCRHSTAFSNKTCSNSKQETNKKNVEQSPQNIFGVTKIKNPKKFNYMYLHKNTDDECWRGGIYMPNSSPNSDVRGSNWDMRHSTNNSCRHKKEDRMKISSGPNVNMATYAMDSSTPFDQSTQHHHLPCYRRHKSSPLFRQPFHVICSSSSSSELQSFSSSSVSLNEENQVNVNNFLGTRSQNYGQGRNYNCLKPTSPVCHPCHAMSRRANKNCFNKYIPTNMNNRRLEKEQRVGNSTMFINDETLMAPTFLNARNCTAMRSSLLESRKAKVNFGDPCLNDYGRSPYVHCQISSTNLGGQDCSNDHCFYDISE
ncbi:hypothetical protein HELRODRAFT_176715 [Helobdella robusta]|uniref:Uncharacterized protein n=1 Tax=Helobdella robusta TaxID=6412 RepID=T1FAT6_HELRO|nr:hypothetical protein HELRODRAFT_176715 [Helobdella robusta]ESN99548.1 hypothetical protein HELRODRAFT_176715 [Helobdella robusta]